MACDSDVASGSSNWYYHPSRMTTASGARILTDDIPRGYVIRRDPSFRRRIYLRRNLDVSASLEGVFTCEIINDSPISIGIYYQSEYSYILDNRNMDILPTTLKQLFIFLQ